VRTAAYYTMRPAGDRFSDASMVTEVRNAVLIYNPRAGRGGQKRRHALGKAQQILRDAGIEAELQATAGPRAATAREERRKRRLKQDAF